MVKISNKQILQFDIDQFKKNRNWIYHINMNIDDCSANLIFTRVTQGFKIETKKESWTVALPKAKINGEISYDGNKMQVDGIGYHDHNWNYTFLSALTYGKGWYWGKIKSQTYTIVWANVMKRSGFWDLLAILCKDNDGYYNIDPKNIIFNPKKLTKFRRRKIPSEIEFGFKQIIDQIPIIVKVTMKVKHIHFSKVFFSSYWRYHVRIKGNVTIGDNDEYIDNIQIMEYLSMF